MVGARNLPRYSGSHSVCPFAKISIRGCKEDKRHFKTSNVEGNGFNPSWKESFSFSIVKEYCATLVIDFYDSKTSLNIVSGSKNAISGIGTSTVVGLGKTGKDVVTTTVATGTSVASSYDVTGVSSNTANRLANRIARCAIPVSSIQNGYRIAKLYDFNGNTAPLFDALFFFTKT